MKGLSGGIPCVCIGVAVVHCVLLAGPAAAVESGDVRFEACLSGARVVQPGGDGGAGSGGWGTGGSLAFRPSSRIGLEAEIARLHYGLSSADSARLGFDTQRRSVIVGGSFLYHFARRRVQPYVGGGVSSFRDDFCAYDLQGMLLDECRTESLLGLGVRAGLKIVTRSGLLVAPELRADRDVFRLGVSIGWAWFRGEGTPPDKALPRTKPAQAVELRR